MAAAQRTLIEDLRRLYKESEKRLEELAATFDDRCNDLARSVEEISFRCGGLEHGVTDIADRCTELERDCDLFSDRHEELEQRVQEGAQKFDARLISLEMTQGEFEQWRPSVDKKLAAISLEVERSNRFFEREFRSSSRDPSGLLSKQDASGEPDPSARPSHDRLHRTDRYSGTRQSRQFSSGDVLSGTTSGGEHHYGVLEGWFGIHWWNGRFFVLLVTTLVVFTPLASLKRVDSLSYTSAISVALAVVFVIITAGIAIVKLIEGKVPMPKLFPSVPDLASVWELFTAVPVLVTAYVCHYNVHPIHNELKEPSQIKPIVHTSLTLCSSVYVATSFFGYLLFGESTLSDVLANFDSNLGIPYSSVLNDAVRVSYALHLMLVFPMIFHALRLNLDGLLFASATPLYSDNRRFGTMTALLLLVIFSFANFIPSIWDAFQFTGATAAVCIAFIFPAAITLRDRHSIAKKWDKYLAVIMIVLAVVSNVVAVYSDAYKMFHKKSASSIA